MISILIEPLIIVNRWAIIKAAVHTRPYLAAGIAKLGSARATIHGQHGRSALQV
jgi:hypothetical protein